MGRTDEVDGGKAAVEENLAREELEVETKSVGE